MKLRQDRLLHLLLLALIPLLLAGGQPSGGWRDAVDWPTIAALAGLLVITRGVEDSGALEHLASRLLDHARTERALALTLVGLSIALATLITNDVTLFVIVPLTTALARKTQLPLRRLVIFEAMAVNAGILTPIGNPQNLYLWQSSGVTFAQFAFRMLPLFGVLAGLMLLLTACSFSSRPIRPGHASAMTLHTGLLQLSVGLAVPFIWLADHHLAVPAFALVLALFLTLRPAVAARVDWGLLLVFILMFVDLRLAAGLPWIHALLQTAVSSPSRLYWSAVALSQFTSNVPATIALSGFTQNWLPLAYGVNVGGFGLWWASLASLIALRLSLAPGIWPAFLRWSIPVLVASALLVWLCLRFVSGV